MNIKDENETKKRKEKKRKEKKRKEKKSVQLLKRCFSSLVNTLLCLAYSKSLKQTRKLIRTVQTVK